MSDLLLLLLSLRAVLTKSMTHDNLITLSCVFNHDNIIKIIVVQLFCSEDFIFIILEETS